MSDTRNPNRNSDHIPLLYETPKKPTSFRYIYNRQFEGWKFTIFLAFVTSVIVLFFNVGFLVYCVRNPKHDPVDLYPVASQAAYRERLKHQIGTILYEGDCEKVHRLVVGFHLLINILSTALLSASNFGMQCLSAPTRKDIDQAHRKGHWLDVGVPGIRNLFRISRIRLLLLLCLALSSLPFHLVYNSAIYSTTSANAYDIFAGRGPLGQEDLSHLNLKYLSSPGTNKTSSFLQLISAANNGSLDRLDNQACLDAFTVTFQEVYRRLLIVTDDVEGNNDTYIYINTNDVFQPIENLRTTSSPYKWLCSDLPLGLASCNSKDDVSRNSRGNWTVKGEGDRDYIVQYCLVDKGMQHCKLQYSFPLTMIVIGFNLVKIGVLLYMWLGISEAPILTTGDAIASFLRHPDPISQGRCLLTMQEVRTSSQYKASTLRPPHRPKTFEDKRRRWGAAVSGGRWTFSVLFWLIGTIVCISLLAYGINTLDGTEINPWTQTLGSVSSSTLIYGDHWPSSLVSNVLIANSPQVIFSFLYLAFNGVLTSMTLTAEWSGYANERKGLRVSNNPQHAQRSNYFLSLPYLYAIPLLVTSTLLHWLISQSLFVVGIEAWGSDLLRDPASDFVTCGWSSVAILGSIIVGLVFFGGIIGLSLRRLESAMPLAGSCSLAIAAACHPTFDPNDPREDGNGEQGEGVDSEEQDEDMSLLPVQWGAVPVNGPLGHCSFTSRDVDMPRADEVLYQ